MGQRFAIGLAVQEGTELETNREVDQKQRRTSRFPGIAALIVVAIALVFGAGIGTAAAGSVVLAWDANTEPDLSGYKLYYGTASRTYGTPITVGNLLTYTATGLTDGLPYYFAVTAYDTVGNESGYSNEVVFPVPSLVEINLVGNAVSIVDGDTTPSTADFTDFGGADLTGATVVRTFTIQNTGTDALSLSGSPLVAVSGANAADFTVTTLPATPVAAAGTTTFSVTFDPSAAGIRNATLTIANNDSNENPYDFAIRGTGNAPEINLVGNGVSIVDGDTTPSTADFTDFGSADLSGATVVRTFTIQNTGTSALSLSGSPRVVVSGANAADFTVTTYTTTPVAVGGITTFSITFDPSAAGTRAATLTIANNDSNENPYDFAIRGTGTAPEINLVGNGVSIVDGDTTPSTADFTDFGGARLADGTVTRTFTIQNTGTGALNLSGTPLVLVGGANAADFTVPVPPTASVAAAGSTTFTVSFDPSLVGTRVATLTIANSDANENPYDFAIQGRGVAPPAAPVNISVVP